MLLQEAPLRCCSASHWTLATGATVSLMRTDFEPDEVLLLGLAVGGVTELASRAEKAVASMLGYMRLLCGVGGMTTSQLRDFLADKNVSVSPHVSNYGRTLEGHCGSSVRDLGTALQMAAWHFTKPPEFTEASFAKVLDLIRQEIANRERDPGHHMRKALRRLTCGDDPIFQEMDYEDLAEVQRLGIQGVRDVYSRCFCNPGEWSWILLGALPDDDTCRKLIVSHLGSLAALDGGAFMRGPLPKPVVPKFSAGERVNVYHGLAEQGHVCLCFDVEPPRVRTASARFAARCAAEVLEARLLDQLRVKGGQSYTVTCSLSAGSLDLACEDRRPMLSISFGCDPELAVDCVDTVLEEVRSLGAGEKPITADELEASKEKAAERLKTDDCLNSEWVGRLDLSLRRTRCFTAKEEEEDEADDRPAPPPVVQDAGQQPQGVVADQLDAAMRVLLRKASRIEALSLPDLQAAAPPLVRQSAMVVATLLPERMRPKGEAGTPPANFCDSAPSPAKRLRTGDKDSPVPAG